MGACQSEEPLNYKEEELVEYLADLSLLESLLDYYPRSVQDSVESTLKTNIIRRRKLDSVQVTQDVKRITSDPDMTEYYFNQVKERLDSLRSM